MDAVRDKLETNLLSFRYTGKLLDADYNVKPFTGEEYQWTWIMVLERKLQEVR